MVNKKGIEVIIVCGTKRCGKDTFYNLLRQKSEKFIRFAFADKLKEYLTPYSYALFHKEVDDLNDSEKETLRPVLIAAGMAARKINPDFWVERIYSSIDYYDSLPGDDFIAIPVITDGRFVNEVEYFQRKYGNKCLVVNIERDGTPEPPDEEKKNAPEVARLADYSIVWPTDPTLEICKEYVDNFYSNFFGE